MSVARPVARRRRRLACVAAVLLAVPGFFVAVAQEAPPDRGAPDALGPGAVEAVLEGVLEEPGYRHLRRPEPGAGGAGDSTPAWLEGLLEWLAEDAEGPLERASDPWPLRALFYGVALCAVVLAVVFLLNAAVRSRRTDGPPAGADRRARRASAADALGDDAGAAAERSAGPQECLERALACGAEEDFRAGIRWLLLGGMRWIERHGLVAGGKGLSNRDYLRAVSARPPAAACFAVLVESFDEVFFGRRPATEARFRACLGAFEEGFAGAC